MPASNETALCGFVARLIGFAPERAQAVEHALQAIEINATYRAALVLCGDGDLVQVVAELVSAVHDARIQLVICGQQPPKLAELVVAPIKIPALATRAHELDRLIDEYVHDAAVALQISAPFTATDRHWVRTYSATSLPELEKGAWRILALREAGNIAGAAALLGMGHTSRSSAG